MRDPADPDSVASEDETAGDLVLSVRHGWSYARADTESARPPVGARLRNDAAFSDGELSTLRIARIVFGLSPRSARLSAC